MNADKKTVLHGTAVLVTARNCPPAAVLLRGLSGSGKSDLALRLIYDGGTLICDDQVICEKRMDKIFVSPVENIHGLIEVRGVGLLKFPATDKPQPLALVIDLLDREDVPRIPDDRTTDILGVNIPLYNLHAFDASAVTKVKTALEVVFNPGMSAA